jgi:hypothetical protein
VTDCSQAGLQAALDTGGHINFSCGSEGVTIPIDTQLELNTTLDTVLDGGGNVTLDGQGLTRILHKGWHNPNTVEDITITLQNIRLTNGKAPGGGATGDHSGGAIAAGHPGTRLHIINSTFADNATTDIHTPDNQGGAIFVHNAYETVLSGSVFTGNIAGNGGALGGIATGLVVLNTRFSSNQAVDDWGGGIVRGYGGAIHLDGVTNSYNPASNGQVHVCGSVFEDNRAVRGGGAIGVVVSDAKGTRATYERSTFNDNLVTGLEGDYGQGGGIYHIEDDHAGGVEEDNLEISRTTFHGNLARRQGGAVWVSILGRGTVTNTTFEGNGTTAPVNQVGQGGAMMATLGVIEVSSVTFANNHAAYQAGALHAGGTGDPRRVVTLKNTIFANNTLNEQDLPTPTEWQGYHTNRPMEDGGQNIQFPRFKPTYNNEINNNITANPIYADPLLLPLADYGGINETMALQSGSPAIDSAAPGCPPTDQRGETRHGPCDIGPFEYLPERIQVNPGIMRVAPGGAASSTLQVIADGDAPGLFDLSVNDPYLELLTDISPPSLSPGGFATLTITDTHPAGEMMPGLWYTLPVTASRAGTTLTADVLILVGGAEGHLPIIGR